MITPSQWHDAGLVRTHSHTYAHRVSAINLCWRGCGHLWSMDIIRGMGVAEDSSRFQLPCHFLWQRFPISTCTPSPQDWAITGSTERSRGTLGVCTFSLVGLSRSALPNSRSNHRNSHKTRITPYSCMHCTHWRKLGRKIGGPNPYNFPFPIVASQKVCVEGLEPRLPRDLIEVYGFTKAFYIYNIYRRLWFYAYGCMYVHVFLLAPQHSLGRVVGEGHP